MLDHQFIAGGIIAVVFYIFGLFVGINSKE